MKLVVGSYNVRDMYGPKIPEGVHSEPKTPAAFAAVADNIEKSGADVVALQEVDNLDVLHQFLANYLPGQFPYSALVEGNDRRGIDVAVISKYPITNVVSHKDLKFPLPEGWQFKDGTNQTHFQRDLLRVDLDLKGIPFSVYTTHLKMGKGKLMEAIRTAETTAARGVLAQEMSPFPSHRFVLTGDLNARPDRGSIAVLQGQGDTALRSSLDALPAGQRGTDHNQQIDYIFYPQQMQSEFRGARILKNTVGSDHSMITASFDIPS